MAKIQKGLHAKRPALYPILDRHFKRRQSAANWIWIRPLSHLGELTVALISSPVRLWLRVL